MSESDTLSPRQVVQQWLDSAMREGQLDAYEAKRSAARCSWQYPLELLVGDELVYVQCRDICAGGIGLVCKRNLTPDEPVYIRRSENEPWVKCRVAHVTRSIGAFKIGVELTFDFD
ncbi:MAG TPA: PilZ domain-containing protein [Phycisphaerae bacterium]|nr:PilZ domain-containing protein [Phycisphaerales bacterium]HRX85361.1 PilZ domain-containing protein [Phycisphaerae bacterium]